MPFDDLTIGLRAKFIELVEELEKGIYKPEFRGITEAMNLGPEIYLYYPTGEEAKTIKLPPLPGVLPVQRLEELGYITTVQDTSKGKRFTGSLTAKARKEYNLHLSPCNFERIVKDPRLAQVLQNRWRECILTLDAGAYLSTIILLGSIVEGVLLDKVKSNRVEVRKAPGAKRDKRGRLVSPGKWSLNDLITVSHQCGWIGKDRNDFAHILRNYRNFVHPNKQVEEGFDFDLSSCEMAKKVVEVVLQDLDKCSSA